MKNYDKKARANGANPKAYKLKAKQLKLGAVSCIHQIINLEQLKQETKKYDVTITQYLTAVLLYSIYKENYLKNKGKRPIKMYIPVNLKKYFPSKTISNFFSYITLQAELSQLENFEKMLELVKKAFEEK